MYDDESTLIEALLRKEEAAFRFVISHYQGTMLQVARSITGDKIADEVVQETWFSVMRALPGFEHRSSLKTWILRIVANEAKTRLRKESRQVSLDAITDSDPAFAERFDEHGHWLVGREPTAWGADSPEDLLAGEELRDCLELVMAALPEMQAATLRLREHEDYSLQEICNILGVSESNVRVLLHRARQRLFGAVEHFENTGECCTTL